MGRTFYETHAFVNIFYIVVRFEVMLDDGTLALVILEEPSTFQKIGAILSRPEYKFESQRKTDGMQYKVKKRE